MHSDRGFRAQRRAMTAGPSALGGTSTGLRPQRASPWNNTKQRDIPRERGAARGRIPPVVHPGTARIVIGFSKKSGAGMGMRPEEREIPRRIVQIDTGPRPISGTGSLRV